MNVLFLTEGGSKTGYGHMCRSLALAQAFDDIQEGVKTEFVICADQRAETFLKMNEVNFSNINWLKNLDQIQKYIHEETAVVIDSYQAPNCLYKQLRSLKKRPYIVALDDYNRIPYNADAIINFSVNGEDCTGYKKSARMKYLAGNEYLVVRRDFYRKHQRRIRKNIKNILILLGGSDFDELQTSLIKLFGHFEYNLHVIMPHEKKCHFDNHKKIEIHSDLKAEQLCFLLQKIDLCITGGGHVLNELACFGIPTIAIGLAKNQLANIRRWEKAGFVKYAGWYQDKNLLGKLQKALMNIRDKSAREQRVSHGEKIINTSGRIKIVKTLMSDYYKKALVFRKAYFQDAKGMFDISNDPLVRKVSFNSTEISWAQHVRWLRSRLVDDNCKIYVCATPKKIYAQVRFDVDAKTGHAVISISLHKDIRGLGLSSWIIGRCVQEFFKGCKNIKKIYAFIKADNIASIKTFKKALFRYSKCVAVKNHRARLYVYAKGQKC